MWPDIHFLMFFGSNLDGLLPLEHVWDLLAAAGGSPMVQSVIFDGFWLPSWIPLGPLFGYFGKKDRPFASGFAGPFWRGSGAGFGLQTATEKHVFRRSWICSKHSK